ncbi:MAG: hypothetical protein A3A96_00500 [Candidatus Zambryskibacteria bacterium RIFCSPLOWO2_01_FULL_39_39]|uniref:Uncharacterized protein n=1 Tax=Candidatus Zambryskibacteria bacterium RIFCSPLOWO2_01_FULL_39_39 TaxID=1802758 RepID=A0A1G2TX79_9BACT|nr:MAG: hypothetical protein A2644_01395 [Candidatus Zambryskibacteria bacterium RIFCSPHIGHO2_01_FULL_39_63]OHA94963.1 MAG: hypothetical protein A3B88_01120 [Candidatus Zambryskibacteria bacterium RIFCSPHIGHO2_02_FULL_39_19]OHA99144.1 MAG: hypothetical protein A3F20_03070 [Candidatus Zambryskibacteria bacterium RIFCSPHIGHO2_12_FULL_39_21]OHB01906.1 MAG: hypothetical protein A3A96_00500 [Candidatus Zambryskibacteria bacterium RIFCSPLOWO2_01_FULL_39_39]
MNTKKALLIIVLVIIAGALTFFISKSRSNYSQTATSTPKVEEGGLHTGIQIKPELPGQTLPFSNDPKDLAWAVFQKYLGYNKDQNLEGVRGVVYKVASVCEDPKTTIDCKARMNLAWEYGNVLKKEDFVNVWEDSKQIILATDFKTREDDSIIGRDRSIIFFVRDENKNLKMLSFSPFKGVIVNKGTASQEELNDRIVRYTEDKDKDGIADYDEECLAVKEGQTCTQTNPKIRDTDGDGLWDGIEALIQ